MKRLTIYLFVSIITLSCSDDSESPDKNTLKGLWVPIEIKTKDGQFVVPPPNQEGPFTSFSIFGFYAESIKFNTDGTYFPAVWTDKDNYFFYDKTGGKYEYSPTAKKVYLTEGQWDMNLDVTMFSNDDLWITEKNILYKLKRQLK